MKIIDLQVNIDGVILKDDENIEDIIKKIERVVNTAYKIQFDIHYEEHYD